MLWAMASEKALTDLVSRLEREAKGLVSTKVITPEAIKNPTLETAYFTAATLNGLSTRESYGARLFEVLYDTYSNILVSGNPVNISPENPVEALDASPLAQLKKEKITLSIPEVSDKFVIGPVHFGKKTVEVPLEAEVRTYEKPTLAGIDYVARPIRTTGRGWNNRVRLTLPRELANEFMQHAEKSPNDVWKIISEHLFSGLFGVEQEFKYEFSGKGTLLGTVQPVKRSGVMYHSDNTGTGSEGALQKTGFEFNKPYLYLPYWYSRESGFFRTLAEQKRKIDALESQLPKDLRNGLDLLPVLLPIKSRNFPFPVKKLTYTPA